MEPVPLVLCEDNYYILCYSTRHKGTANYRVDRMEAVTILEDDCSPEALAMRENVDDYTEQTFKMFAGPKVGVTLEFSGALIGPVYDKFGEDTQRLRLEKMAVTRPVSRSRRVLFSGAGSSSLREIWRF